MYSNICLLSSSLGQYSDFITQQSANLNKTVNDIELYQIMLKKWKDEYKKDSNIMTEISQLPIIANETSSVVDRINKFNKDFRKLESNRFGYEIAFIIIFPILTFSSLAGNI